MTTALRETDHRAVLAAAGWLPVGSDPAGLVWQIAEDGEIFELCFADTNELRMAADVIAADAHVTVQALCDELARMGFAERDAPASPAVLPVPPVASADGHALVDLALIDDNPYQPRLAYDEERIAAIATSIMQHGLLQTPLARRTPDGRYQLAFGHSRFRAYQRLAAADPAMPGASRFARMPLALRALDDETMALHAWIENRDRKDLTAYEEAMAIQRYTARFGWSQAKAAEKLQLDRSTIANKLRLLKLPAAALEQLRDGKLSERQAAALLPLADLPAEAQAQINLWDSELGDIRGMDGLITKAPKIDSTRLRKHVDMAFERVTVGLDKTAWWKDAWEIPFVHAARCQECPLRIKAGNRCPGKACAARKQLAWQAQKALAAAASVKLPASGEVDWGTHDRLDGVKIPALRKVAEERGCSRLAVIFKPGSSGQAVKGHPDCYIVCAHGQGKRCGCLQSLASRPETAEASRAGQEKATKQRIKAELLGPAETAVREALGQPGAGVWRYVLQRYSYSTADKLANADEAAILTALAKAIVEEETKYSYKYGASYPTARRELEQLLAKLGAPVPWDVRAQTPDESEAP